MKSRTRWGVATYSRVVPGASGRVLVVDDNKVIRQLIRVNLELEGFEVVTAADGAECLDVVHQVRPDAVTLDVVMPRLDGLQTAARLRSDPRTRDLPLAIVSACTQFEVDSGLDVGVDAFLSKPFEPAELVLLVKRLVDSRRRDGDDRGDRREHGDRDDRDDHDDPEGRQRADGRDEQRGGREGAVPDVLERDVLELGETERAGHAGG
ncbi:response regulator [Streptomyces griseoviridis]|uniref:response regulator n=1 Tax=Streptomyces griseoviridis TaxID=45398 RepID=UPI001F0C8D29|nr:response regulator [Streptomyces griseoviridis]